MSCTYTGCQEPAQGQYWNGQSYCRKHYDEMMSNDFEREKSRWKDDMPPSDRLLYLCGRYLDEGKWTAKGGLMTNARLRDRSFNFKKEDAGFTFEITRHPGAFQDDYNPFYSNRIVEEWRVSFRDGVVEFVGNRPWTSDDPE